MISIQIRRALGTHWAYVGPGDASGAHCACIRDTLGMIWGCIRDALGTLWEGIGDTSGLHWGRFGDAQRVLGMHREHWGQIGSIGDA